MSSVTGDSFNEPTTCAIVGRCSGSCAQHSAVILAKIAGALTGIGSRLPFITKAIKVLILSPTEENGTRRANISHKMTP
jgi:hypothetical protein